MNEKPRHLGRESLRNQYMLKPANEHVSLKPIVGRFCIAFFVAAISLAIILVVLYRQDVEHQRSLLDGQGQHVLNLQEELLSLELRTVASDLRYLASQQPLREFVAGNEAAAESVQREYVNFAIEKGIYDQIRCLDLAGQEIVRVNYSGGTAQIVPQGDLQSKATRYYYQQARSLESTDIFVSTFDLNVERGEIEKPIKPVIRFVTPVVDKSKEKRGFLVLNFLGARLLSQLKGLAGSFDGETMLLNAEGEYLLASHAEHEWGWLLGHNHRFRDDYPEVWRQLRDQSSATIEAGGETFHVRRVSLGITSPESHDDIATATKQASDDSLILVARVSSAIARDRSAPLLHKLLYLTVAVMIVISLLCYYWARTSVFRRYHERQIADSERRLRQLSSQLLAAQETERRNLSRDLHDEIGQQATAISLDLQSLKRMKDDASADGLLDRTIEETNKLLESLHEVARQVRPRVLDDLGLHDAVESLLSEFEHRKGVVVESELHFSRDRIPSTIGENVFRIIQEALANVATHAQTNRAQVNLQTDQRSLRLSVRDEGIGFDVSSVKDSARLGLLGMQERVELLDGHFNLESSPGAGTRIDIEIPLPADESSNG